jgi:hypothetical protein
MSKYHPRLDLDVLAVDDIDDLPHGMATIVTVADETRRQTATIDKSGYLVTMTHRPQLIPADRWEVIDDE